MINNYAYNLIRDDVTDKNDTPLNFQSRYCRFTPLAKTLQEDPSCQLCSVLQKFVLQTDILTIEGNLRETELPNLSTLRQVSFMLLRA